MKKIKEFFADMTETVSVTKLDGTLIVAIAALSGVIIGMLISPRKNAKYGCGRISFRTFCKGISGSHVISWQTFIAGCTNPVCFAGPTFYHLFHGHCGLFYGQRFHNVCFGPGGRFDYGTHVGKGYRRIKIIIAAPLFCIGITIERYAPIKNLPCT